jgi:hypothetical protein
MYCLLELLIRGNFYCKFHGVSHFGKNNLLWVVWHSQVPRVIWRLKGPITYRRAAHQKLTNCYMWWMFCNWPLWMLWKGAWVAYTRDVISVLCNYSRPLYVVWICIYMQATSLCVNVKRWQRGVGGNYVSMSMWISCFDMVCRKELARSKVGGRTWQRTTTCWSKEVYKGGGGAQAFGETLNIPLMIFFQHIFLVKRA